MDLNTLSVVNPRPERLKGPALLHELVPLSSELPALEHLGIDAKHSFSYAQLQSASDVIASKIRSARHSSTESFIVPVLHSQSPGLYVALLGILKAGGAFCPLNLDIPTERLQFILKDVSATVAVVASELRDTVNFPEHVQIIYIGALDTYTTPPQPDEPQHILPTDLAYVMYTSGSTGVPKGVAISHDAATQALMAHDSHVPSFERFFQFAAPTFDVSVFEIFFPLSRGKTLVSARRAATLEDLALVLRTMEVDACELTPTVAAGLLRNRTSVPRLRTLLTIGEMLNKSVVDEFGGSQDQPTMLWAMYGPTEATIHCTLMPEFQSDMPVGTIGFPLQTVSCFILDPTNPIINGNDLNVLPRGEIGELAVGGFQLADGYLNRPEQTAAAFITTSHGRIYRTGDKARLNESGILECLGRLSDGQIKLRGQRIELGEIEQAMLNTPKCRVATALVVNSVLVGFCAVEPSVTEDDILTKCRQWLPSHMVPSEIVLLEDLPKLPSGKVDRHALRQSLEDSDRDRGQEDGAADQGDEGDNDVVQAITKCLNKSVTTNSSLVSLGIDSLQAIKLASMLRKQGIYISVADILRARKVSDLSPIAQDSKPSKQEAPPPVESLLPHLSNIIADNATLKDLPGEVEDVMPCTQLQIAMLTTRDDFPADYHNDMEYEIDGTLSLDTLAAGLRTICDNNQILRTRFATWQEVPVAIVYASHLEGTVQIATQETMSTLSKHCLSWLKPLQIWLFPGVGGQNTRISIKAHHAIYDGWSMDAIFIDLWNFAQGCNIIPRPQFRQILEYENMLLHEQDGNMRFWADQLTGWSRKTFPTLVEKPDDVTQRATTHSFSLSEAKLKLALDRLDCGTSALFLAALCMVWKGILGSDDVVIGTTTSGRTLPLAGIDEIIGPCIAALPLRIQFERMETSDQLVKYIQHTSNNLLEHATLGLSHIRKLAGLQAFESLYDVLFTYQESLYSEAVKQTPFRQVRHLDRLETKLLLEVEPAASGFSLQATYHTDVLDQSMASHILKQVAASFQDIVDSAGDSLPAASFPTSAALSLHNHPVHQPATTLDLASGFEEVAARLPKMNALKFLSFTTDGIRKETMTYEELNKRSNQVARWLQNHGVHSNTTVAIVMEKSISLYVNILAIIKAGCGYLPLLPSTPRLRVRDILTQARVGFCVVDAISSVATAETSSVALLSPTKSELEQFADSNLSIAPDADRLAYVIYTSGTTGKPKGVSVTQQNIVSNVQHLRDTYPADNATQSRLLQACSQAFDVSVFEIFFSWFAGMCLCSGTNDTIFADIEQTIRTLDITHLSLTPTVASMIQSKNVPSVRFLVTAGEPLTRPVLDQWGTLLWQGYGPSETTNICTVKRMHHSFNIEHLGHTFPNTSVAVLQTEGLSTLPLGWVGELCYGGLQVASGYMGDASLTAAKFIDHERYGRLYRSGDLGRMLPDGSLVILGRIDTQVKLRGQRIETAEIDHICSQQPAVHTATTLLLDVADSSASQCLASFFTLQSTSEADVLDALPTDRLLRDTLFAALRAHLPSYMIPTYVIPVSRIPRTSSGKCDNRALRTLFNSLSKDHLHQCSQIFEGPDSHGDWLDHEKIIRSSLAESLKVPEHEIGRWTSFSAIGLDSISAIHAAASLSRTLSASVSISSLLLYPCISLLSQHLRDKPQSSPARQEPLLPQETHNFVLARFQDQPEQVADILPCTPLQEGMLSHGTDNYYNRVLLRLRSHPGTIQECWKEVCRRHDILRTCFMSTHDRTAPIVQVVLKDWTIPWHSFSMNDLSMVAVVESHKKTLPEVIDSKTPPLSLATITYRGSFFLSILCHHAIYDGTAISTLWREVEALVHGRSLPPPVPYGPFLAKTRQQPEDWASFWKKQLQHRSSRLVLASASREAPAQQAIHTATLEHRLDETQRDLHNAQVGLQSLCQGAWAMVLSAFTGSQDVVFGNVVSGRNIDVPGIERLVAPCFNTVPIRQTLDEGLQNHSLLRRLQKLNDELRPYQFTALRDIMKLVHSHRLFDTLLLVQQPLEEMDESVWTLEEDIGDMDVPLVCEVTPCPNLNSVSVKMYYDMNILTDDEVSAICNEFTTTVAYLAKSPFAQVSLQPIAGLTRKPMLAHTRYEDGNTVANAEPAESAWTPLEHDIRECLVQLTSVPKAEINKSTSFFRLGIDSISAIQLTSMLRDKGCVITAADVMANSTCSRLAQELSSRTAPLTGSAKAYDFDAYRSAVSKDIAKIVPKSLQIEDVLPCTPLQCAMAASSSKNGNYLNQIKFSLDTDLTPSRMRSAWEDVRRQHHLLRTALIPVSHAKAPFAMVTYSAESLEMPLEEAHSSQDQSNFGEALRKEFGKRLQELHHLPPWNVTLRKEGSHFSMYLVIHHALYDAVSLRQILDDLASALCGHGVPVSVSPKIGLAELLVEDSSLNKNSEEFWSSLAAKVVINRFPVLTPLREPDGRQTISITSSMSYSSIQEGCKAREVTFQALLQAAWTRVLSAYTGEDSVVFGVTFSNRDTEATKKTPLPCLSTLPVIATNHESNEELLKSVSAYDAKLTAFRRSSLADVQRWLGYPSSSIFDSILVYQGHLEGSENSHVWTIEDDVGLVEYTVALEVEPCRDGEVRLSLSFLTSVIPQEQAGLIVRQFDSAIYSSLHKESSDDAFRRNPTLFSALKPQVDTIPTEIASLHEFVRRQATETPDAPALEFLATAQSQPVVWNYQELNDMGNRVAKILLDLKVSGTLVAVHFDKCPEAYFAILGALKAGFGFVALDPSMPKARKEFIMQDSGACCLLVGTTFADDFEVAVPLQTIDIPQLNMQSSMTAADAPAVQPSSTCYCLYTSGTTGTPKGCEITHENAVQAMMAFQHLFRGRWNKSSRWLQFAALHFDVSILEQYWTWSVGMTMVVTPRDVILDDLAGTISRLRITHLDLTPSLARLLDPADVPTLWDGVFITGGEQLRQEILDVWGPKGAIFNAYGPTEATIGVTTYPQVPQNGRPSNIGRPFLNVGTYVLQPSTDRPVLRGAVGELCIAGKLVGKGYINRAETTRERFPWIERFSERIYRTGDLVRVLADGSFDFLGRADDQVKLRGQRLELGEIDHVIRKALPQLEDMATIVVTQKSPDRSVLVCFLSNGAGKSQKLQPTADEQGLGSQARAACRSQLPAYMVPTYFLVMPYIPLSINNKAEHKVLRRVFEELSADDLMSLVPSTATSSSKAVQSTTEQIMLALSEFSGVSKDTLQPTSSIFEAGVDSINVLLFTSALRRYGVSCPAALALQNPVLAELGEALTDSASNKTDTSIQEARVAIKATFHRQIQTVRRVLGFRADMVEYIAPCTPLQEGMVTAALSDKRHNPYFVSFELELASVVDVSALRSAWQTLIEHYAILRTAFLQTPNGCVQVACRSQTLDWVELATDLERISRKAAWMDRNCENIVSPLQLTILHTEGSTKLCMDLFHGIYDGVSLHHMLQEVKDIYHGHHSQRQAPDFIEAMAYGPLFKFDYCKDFWVHHFRNLSPQMLERTTAIPREPATPMSIFRTITRKDIDSLPRHFGVTHQTIILALWTSALTHVFQKMPTIGLVIAGRALDLVGVEDTIGPLFNTLPFFAGSCAEESWSGLISHCHQFSSSILSFQHVPLRQIQKWCSSGQRLLNNLLTVQPEEEQSNGNALWEVAEPVTAIDYPLALEATVMKNGDILLHLVADGQLATEGELQNLLDHMEASARFCSQSSSAPWTELLSSTEYDAEMFSESGNGPEATVSSNFQWSPKASRIRQSLANLAGCQLESVGAHTSLLELGLDSIDVLRLSSNLRSDGVIVAPSTIMRCQTIANLVPMLHEDAPAHDAVTNTPDLETQQQRLRACLSAAGQDISGIEDVLPATPLQEGMVMAMFTSDFQQYFNHEILKLRADLDVDELRAAWNQVVQANPILRTGFAEVSDEALDSSYCQIVHKFEPLHIPHDRIDAPENMKPFIELARVSARQSMGFDKMLQVRFASCGSDNYMLISIAHALYDGWSLSLLYDDLQTSYDGLAAVRPLPQTYLSHQVGTNKREQDAFWEDFLHKAEPTILDSRFDPMTDFADVLHEETVSAVTVGEISAFCKKQGVSLQVLCYACWALVLARRCGQLDVSFGAVLSGRDFEGADELMFPTMNTIAQRCILNGTVAEFLSYIEQNMRDIRPRQSYPLRKALSTVARGQALFDSIFMMQKSSASGPPSSEPMFNAIMGNSETDYPICAESELNDRGLVWRLASRSQAYRAKGVAQLLQDLDAVLHFMLRSPASDILSMQGEAVSICGLDPTPLRHQPAIGATIRANAKSEEPVTWSSQARAIAEVLSAVSHVPLQEIKPWNSIYHLGLDSITTIKLSLLLKKRSINIRPRDLLRASDIVEMASMAEDSSAKPEYVDNDARLIISSWTPPPETVEVDKLLAQHNAPQEHVEAVTPASAMQVYVIRSWYMNKGSIFFPEFRIRLPAETDPSKVSQAWDTLRDEVPLLRAMFYLTASVEIPLVQVVMKSRFASKTPSWSKCWVETDEEGSHALVIKIHHALYDAFTLPSLVRRLLVLCSASPVAVPPYSLVPWIDYTVRPTLSESRETKERFWKTFLGGVKADDIKPLSTRSQLFETRTSFVNSNTGCQSSSLRRAAATAGTSVQALFLAACAKTTATELHDNAFNGSVVLGMYFANRDRADVLPACYPTLSIIPIRVKVDANISLVSSARQIQRDINDISAQGMAEVGLWEIHRWTGVTVNRVVNFITQDIESSDEPGVEWLTGQPSEKSDEQRAAIRMLGNWSGDTVTEAYPPVTEIEASLDEESLTVGVIGPQSMITNGQALEMVHKVTSILQEDLAQ